MPGKKIARKRPGSRCEADLALRTARALPPPFLLWLVAYCTFSTPPWYFLKINVKDAIVVRSRFTVYAFHDSGELVLLGGHGRCRGAGWCVFLFWKHVEKNKK